MPVKIAVSSLPRHIAQQASKHLEGEDIVFVDTASFWRTHRLASLLSIALTIAFVVAVAVVATRAAPDIAAFHYALIALWPLWCVVLAVLARRHARQAPFLLVSNRSAMISHSISLAASTVASVHVIDLRGIRDVAVHRGLCGSLPCCCCGAALCNVVTLRIATQADEHFTVVGLSQPERAYDFLMRGTVLAIPMLTPKKPTLLQSGGNHSDSSNNV
jgi:hypothetical protein